MDFTDVALTYVRAGLCTLPAKLPQKQPALSSWKELQERLPYDAEVARWFGNAQAVCLVTGRVSGNLELLDFDVGGELYPAWRERVMAAAPDLLDRLVVEQSFSQGWHVVYRCESPISGNLKLARRRQPVSGPEEVTICGKRYVPNQDAQGQWYVLLTLIETRGEGGLFLCAPSPGYTLQQGQFTDLPVLTEAQRELLLETAWSLNELPPEPETPPVSVSAAVDGRPGDDFNQRGDVRAVLRRHGWNLSKPGDNEYWCRPGKSSGTSATLKNGVFYVFSSNATPFESDQAYAPFAVYALLEHSGDYAAAASTLRMLGFGGEPVPLPDVNISHLIPAADGTPVKRRKPALPETEQIPLEMLRIPGFVSEVIDLCMESAPYPNQPMTFCGALALQAFLAGRKVRDSGDNRTNIYLLGLAYSSAGKDWIRKLNAKILQGIGLRPCLGDRLASGEGIQSAMHTRPSMLFQTDEIDGILQSINKARDARHESIMSTLLTFYSSSNSIFAMRPLADKPDPGAIDQPNLVLFGTAIPKHFYAALSERMLTNGFFARQIVVEAGKRKEGQEPGIIRVSPRVMEMAKWWADFRPSTGNLQQCYPEPLLVEHTPAAKELLIETRLLAEREYAKAEEGGDPVGTTVWGRVSEHTRKLALIYAVSENHVAPRIDLPAVQWASEFVVHQTRRMLYKAQTHVADNPFHADCLKVMEKLREAPNQQLSHSKLLKRMKIDALALQKLIMTLEQQDDVVSFTKSTGGRAQRVYQLLEGEE